MTKIALIKQALGHGQKTALIDAAGAHTYDGLLATAINVAGHLLQDKSDLQETPVAFMVAPGFPHVAVQWGIWMAGGIAVPLCISHPLPEIDYVLQDTGAEILLCDAEFAAKLGPLAGNRTLRLIQTEDALQNGSASPELPGVITDRRAMILYTSGTTSKPKGVVTTHDNITAQITSLVEAWEWTSEDHILLTLPLHHTHGIINVLSCALWSGAVCTMLRKFDASDVWAHFLRDDLTLFMAVPTIYSRLAKAWEEASTSKQAAMTAACKRFRLMVSGSAALPVPLFAKWQAISGHTLLERYGMTEIGMALSNPLHGERRPGTVGQPLPGVQVRMVDEQLREIKAAEKPGELEVRGKGVFKEYWNRPKETREAFHEGWFRTGDEVIVEDGYYRILGRKSVDIIKTGGYKVSALEIEDVLRAHPAIGECAVVSTEDPEWGECVCAAVVLANDHALTLDELRAWCKERMAPYKIPHRLLCVSELPRNVLGKVTKPKLKSMFAEDTPKESGAEGT